MVSTLLLSQCTYINTFIKHFKLKNTHIISTPLKPNVILSNDQSPITMQCISKIYNILYQELLGSFAWAVLSLCPVVFTTSILTQFT
ncbi:uncharacterized protein F5147DRAFT_573828 [Suillus discolor]|uniref:Uncharacterized protein n=1 Tax=Suillus discolor TaxID=1912936 RepID=A0A9P7FAJ3_9AGAM|nr:uncharacterized protein F5147DRAFT_573828 [Suillus discolor]KAG2111137.1 hypothetical protein F5147DRAFT_573828 [Suillus discolor]